MDRRAAKPIEVFGPSGRRIAVEARVSARARRMTLRIAPGGGGAVLTLPPGAPTRLAERFAQDRAGWLERHLDAGPARVPFADGAVLPLLGADLLLRHCPGERGARIAPGAAGGPPELRVGGEAAHFPRRVSDWLRGRARAEVVPRARAHAASLGRRPARISVRDTTSRWGSCSSRGALSFSWRLVLAPEPVLDYVCAHEAAHLAEMNHSPAFWRLVAGLVGDWETPRRWLRRHGSALHRYG